MMRRTILVTLILAAALHAAIAAELTVPPVVRGVVTAVNGPYITVMRTITVDTKVAVLSRNKKNITIDAIKPGARVIIAISGQKSSKPGALLAEKINVEPAEGSLTAPIDAASAGKITIAGRDVALTAETFFGGFADGKAIASALDLTSGLPVTVDVAATDDGLAATAVTVLGPAPRAQAFNAPPVVTIAGTVASIENTKWTVGSTTVYVSGETKIVGNVSAGDAVEVVGLKATDTAVLANTIRRK